MNSTNQASLIERLEGQLYGMQLAHKLITEYENSAIDHYAREVDLLAHRITRVKSENFSIPCVSPRAYDPNFGEVDCEHYELEQGNEDNDELCHKGIGIENCNHCIFNKALHGG